MSNGKNGKNGNGKNGKSSIKHTSQENYNSCPQTQVNDLNKKLEGQANSVVKASGKTLQRLIEQVDNCKLIATNFCSKTCGRFIK